MSCFKFSYERFKSVYTANAHAYYIFKEKDETDYTVSQSSVGFPFNFIPRLNLLTAKLLSKKFVRGVRSYRQNAECWCTRASSERSSS